MDKSLPIFLNTLFVNKKVSEFIELRYQDKDKVNSGFFSNISDIVYIIETKQEYVKQVNIWYSICPRKDKKGTKEFCSYAPALWMDIDNVSDTDFQQILAELFQDGFQPSIIVHSGHGYHLYWVLTDRYEFDTPESISILESVNRGLAKKYGGDNTIDISRVMRLPYTWNNKKEPVQCTIVQITDKKYNISQFMDLKIESTITDKKEQVSQIETVEKINVDTLKIKDWCKHLIKFGWEKDSRYASASEADFGVMVSLLFSRFTDEMIRSIFYNPEYKISKKVLEKGNYANDYFTTTLKRAKEAYEQRRNEYQEKIKSYGNFEEIEKVHHKWFHIEDEDYLKVIHACILSHQFNADPLWLLLVAPPSTTKTSFLLPATHLPDVFAISDITSKTLFSGDKPMPTDKRQPSFMYNLTRYEKDDFTKTHGILIFKDFTTILQLNHDQRSEILQQLREIYDGGYNKSVGKSGSVPIKWEGKVTFLAGCTEFYEEFRQIDQTLGERYLLYKPKIDDKNRVKMALKSTAQIGLRSVMKKELEDAVKNYHLTTKIEKDIDKIHIPDDILLACANMSSLVTKLRSSVKRDYRGEITQVPNPEAPTRLHNQLIVLMKALTIINKQFEVTDEEYRIAQKLAIMTVSNDRYALINCFINESGERVDKTISDLAQETGHPYSTIRRTLENLRLFGALTSTGYDPHSKEPIEFHLSDSYWHSTLEARLR